jgi:eukaryotic-like serine/threonine-protein kinase
VDETTVDTSVTPLQPGDPRRLGSYDLIGRLGAGGQGAVFLGTSPSGDRVAVKLLHPDLTQDTDARGRFVREAMAAKQVARFCAAQVLDVQVAGDRPFIVSEYVPGPSVHRLVKDGGPLSDGPLERLAIGTATALVAIHQAGIVHRDLKPANVLVGPDGPRVIDFGIAKALATTATATSRVLGTPAYMAPEQVRGGPVDGAVDVFAWGALMVFVATGRPPFGTDSIPQVVQRILGEEPDLTGLPEPLRGLIRDCLAKDPAARPTASQILLRLLGQGAATMSAAVASEPAGGGAGVGARAGAGAGVGLGGVGPGGAGAAGPDDALEAGAAEAAVAADVLAQAATIAGIRPPVAAGPTAALGAPPGSVTMPAQPYETVRTPQPAQPAQAAQAVQAVQAGQAVQAASAAPVAKRPALSRAFIAAGLAAVVVAIVLLLLSAMRPYGTSGNPEGGTPGTSPAGQIGTEQNGPLQGSGQPRQQTTQSSGGTTPQIAPGTAGQGAGGVHGSPSYAQTSAPPTTHISTPTTTPTTTASSTPSDTPTATPYATPSTESYEENSP